MFSCPTLCIPVDCNLPGFSVHGILQARILEWVTILFSRVKNPPANGGDIRNTSWILGLGRIPGVGNGNPLLQYSCLENFMDRGAWQATVHGLTRSQT